MPAKLPSHLMKSRHGIFYLRLTHNGKEKRKSLHTRDPIRARAAAFKLGHNLSIMKKTSQEPQESLESLEAQADRDFYDSISFKSKAQEEFEEEEAFQRKVEVCALGLASKKAYFLLKTKNETIIHFLGDGFILPKILTIQLFRVVYL